MLILSAWCWDSACQVLSRHHKWISVYVCLTASAHALVCLWVIAGVCCQIYLCFWKCVSEHYAPMSGVCVSSWAHCEGVIVEPRPCKLSDSERCFTSKGHAFWVFPVYYKPCNTHQCCCSATSMSLKQPWKKNTFLTRRALDSKLHIPMSSILTW